MLKILVYNIEQGKVPVSIVSEKVRLSDVTVLCEEMSMKGSSIGEAVAKAVNFHCVRIPLNGTAVLSRYPIQLFPYDHTVPTVGVKIPSLEYPVHIIPVHFSDFPYQPFQALDIPYCDGTGEPEGSHPSVTHPSVTHPSGCQVNAHSSKALREQAIYARGRTAAKVALVAKRLANYTPVFICGDFNEPVDWTDRAVRAGLAPTQVQFPTHTLLKNSGFVDSFRSLHIDEVSSPGYTWPARKVDYGQGRSDRIDFIYHRSADKTVKSETLDGGGSDHKAVLSTVKIGRA